MINNHLIRINTGSSDVYIDINEIIFISYNAYKDILNVSFKGGASQSIEHGKQVLDVIKQYIFEEIIEVSVDE